MTTKLDRPGIDRPDTVHKPITGDFAQAIIGYSMCFRCEQIQGCDNEVEWYGNQHGCVEAHVCDFHMMKFYRDIMTDLATDGFILCRICRLKFQDWDTFVRVRRI